MSGRKFDGKRFKLHSLALGKKTARASVAALKGAGWLVRTITKGRTVTIYKRRK